MPLRKPTDSAPSSAASAAPVVPSTKRHRRRFVLLLVVLVVGLVVWGVRSVRKPDPLHEVHAAIDRRDFDTANELLTRYLATHPNDDEVRLLAARTARRSGDFQRATEHLSAYSQRNRMNEAYSLEVTLRSAQQGSKNDAERLFAEYSARPNAPDTPFVMEAYLEGALNAVAPSPDSVINNETGDRAFVAQLHTAADLWLKLRPNSADQIQGLVWKARIFRYSREHAKSVAALREALTRDPDHYQARLHLAMLLGQDAPDESLANLVVLHKRRPNDVRIQFLLATAHRALGHAAEARRLLDQMLAADPSNLSALVELGLLNLDEGKIAEAEPLLRKAHDSAPDMAETNIAMIRCMQLAGKPDAAARYQKRFDEIEAARKALAQK